MIVFYVSKILRYSISFITHVYDMALKFGEVERKELLKIRISGMMQNFCHMLNRLGHLDDGQTDGQMGIWPSLLTLKPLGMEPLCCYRFSSVSHGIS